MLDLFKYSIGIYDSNIDTAVITVCGSNQIYWGAYFSHFNYTVDVIEEYHNIINTYSSIENCLANASTAISSLSDTNKDNTQKEKIVSLYAKLSTCNDFIKSPSGSFNELGSRRSNFKNETNELISQIDVVL
jgi:hypothetical protein